MRQQSDLPLKLAVLLSGGGRTLSNLIEQIRRETLNASIVAVVSSVPDAGGLAIARAAGIPATTVRRREHSSDDEFSQAIYRTLAPGEPELILLAGFLRRLVVPPPWRGRILNIHPALLPESGLAGRGYFGGRVHAAVIASGADTSGATVHVVDDAYDTGPVVLRQEVPVYPDDTAVTLAARVFAAECALYPAAIRTHVAAHPELFGQRGR